MGHLFAETRPYATHPQILRLADITTDFSFPSDHAVMGGAVAAGLLLVNRRLGLLACLAAEREVSVDGSAHAEAVASRS